MHKVPSLGPDSILRPATRLIGIGNILLLDPVLQLRIGTRRRIPPTQIHILPIIGHLDCHIRIDLKDEIGREIWSWLAIQILLG